MNVHSASHTSTPLLVSTQYPWFDHFPLREQKYFLSFDLDKKSFVAKLYPANRSNTPEVESLKQEVLTRLQLFGIRVETTTLGGR